MRERRRPKTESFAGSLLLAHPALKDPNFHRTVVLMSVHNAEGAMGVVLNRPLGRRLAEYNSEFAYGSLASVPVFRGGPVEAEKLIFVAWEAQRGGFRLHFGVEPERAMQLHGEAGTQVRVFLGYSGWSAGQLETEMSRRTWVVANVPPDLLPRPPDDTLWRTVLGELSGEWRLFADEPDEPGAN